MHPFPDGYCRHGNPIGLFLSLTASDKPPHPTNAEKLFSYIKVRPVITGLVQQPVQIVVRFAHTI
jgi:hypothetical protein